MSSIPAVAGSHRFAYSRGPAAKLLGVVGLALVALVLGLAIAASNGFGINLPSVALIILSSAACIIVIMAGPVACLAAIPVLTVATFGLEVGGVGSVGIAPADVFYVALVGWWLRDVIGRAQSDYPVRRPPVRFGQGIAIAFFVYSALTFWPLMNSNPSVVSEALISWLRFMQAASIAFLATSVIRTPRDVRLALGGVVLAAALAVVFGATSGSDWLTGRSASALTPNAVGLLSGFLVVVGAFGAVAPQTRARIAIVLIGLFGLLLAKSVASFVATGLALALGFALFVGHGHAAAERALRAGIAVGLAAFVVVATVQVFRPEVLPGSPQFAESSAYRRMLVITSGLEIAKQHPLIGVGWRQSSNASVIGDRDIALAVRRRFPEARPVLYPDITPTSVHNTYVQILADLGLVGFALFAAILVRIAVAVRALLRRIGPEGALLRETRVMALGLLLLLVWFNETPLFGGQPPMVVATVLVGTLAATSRIVGTAKGSKAVLGG